MTKPTVSLCMIARDEEKNLSKCLKDIHLASMALSNLGAGCGLAFSC
jgi:hypothetical protein